MKKLLPLLVAVLFTQFSVAQNAPVATNDNFTILKNNPVSLPVLSNDFDSNGGSLAVTILLPPLHGTASVSNGTISYLPNLNYTGFDSLTYVLCDTTNLCDTALVAITILNVNTPPVANDDTYTISPNVLTSLPVTSNDYDPDGDALTVSILTPPLHGTANVNGTQIDYTPNTSYFGTDTFVYVICDTANLCDTATVYVTIGHYNQPPIYTIVEFVFTDTINSEEINQMLYDPDGDSIFYASVTNLDIVNNMGSLSINSNGTTLTFVRNGIACGTNRFQFILCDPYVCDTGIITIHITCPENIFLTEGFSPDGDGINDKLVFTRLEYFSPAALKVYNRYGTLVYASEDYKNDWDGTHLESNKPLPDGTYFYIIELTDGRKYNNYLIINR